VEFPYTSMPFMCGIAAFHRHQPHAEALIDIRHWICVIHSTILAAAQS
jgi:hypothetical protein